MPEQKDTAHFESGRATAPPSICYSSQLDSTNRDYTDIATDIFTNSQKDISAATCQSSSYAVNLNNLTQRTNSSPDSFNYKPHSGSSPYGLPTSTKGNVTNLCYQSLQCPVDNFASSRYYTPSFANSSSNNSINNISNNSSFEFARNSKVSPKDKPDFYTPSETCSVQSAEQPISSSFNCSKLNKPNSVNTLKHTVTSSNTLFPSNTQPKYCHNGEPDDLFLEKNSRLRKNFGEKKQSVKTFKDDNFEELQQLFSKNGSSKNPEEDTQNLVTDSVLNILQKKNFHDNFSYDLGDINPILVSFNNKYKAEEVSGSKKKESNEELRLMNEFLTKILSEKEEKRFKSLEEKKKVSHKESFDNLNNEIDERKIKRDAMSHYQEDKNHQKRSSNYGDYNQWEYFGQQDIQSSNNHNRRGHFPFGGSSQQHSVGWNPMGIGMPRQSNPYYTNPHGPMMPAHAHSDYRFNQWNNPNHKNIPNVHNAHSQNTALPQSKMDIKHHSDISNSVQDFGLPIGSTSEFSKYRAVSRDLMHRSPSNLTEKSTRAGTHPDRLASIPPSIRNSSALRTPPISIHPKPVINPLSDLQMLVTNQDSDKLPQKNDNVQQESVDLSAHSEIGKQKENLEEKPMNGSNKDVKEFRSPVSVIQIQNKQSKSDLNESEKPVELTAKCTEKSAEVTVPPSTVAGRSDLEKKNSNSGKVTESAKETKQNEVVKSGEGTTKVSVIIGKDGESTPRDTKIEGDIPEVGQNKESEKKEKEKSTSAVEKEEEGKEKVQERVSEANKSEVSRKGTEEESHNNKQPKAEISVESSEDPQAKSEGSIENSRNCKRKSEEEEESSGVKKKVALEVESQKGKACEGVVKENSDLPTVTSTSSETKPVVSEIAKKTPKKKKPLRKSRIGRLSSGQSSGSERSLSCKKSKSAGNKEEGKKKVKKSLCDVMDRRGPFLHVEGSRESPASVIVVNFPKGDDEDEKEKSSAKKQILNASRTKHHNELDYRGRSKNGLYSSTLSARYDAHTTDHTWICVFCKKGPHYNTMGDLFGPYIISKDENTSLGDFSGDEKDISDAQKRGGRNKKSLRSNNMVEHFQKMSRKLRRTQSTESCLIGMCLISDDHVDQLRYEVWVHEQCAVWSPNVFLIGSRIIGMQEAIWCSVRTVCSKCGISGANIGCVYRNCPNRSHYHCAKESGWSLEQENFISTCYIHKSRS